MRIETRTVTLIGLGLLLLVLATARMAYAYDATYNFDQQTPELVSGWNAYAGPTKGGPYPVKVDCKKPAAKADGTRDCTVPGLAYNPVYGVVVNYGGDGKEISASTEATLAISVPPPTSLKILVTVKTVSSISRDRKPIASTTISRKEIADDAKVNEGTTSRRDSNGNWVTTTKLVMSGT